MAYFAHFTVHEGHQFRFDTRIYLRDHDEPSRDDTCVAAIIGKNPGSANPTAFDRLTVVSLGGDKLLPYVRNRFISAYRKANRRIRKGAYVRVWNLLYLCDPSLAQAIKKYHSIRRPSFCDTEDRIPPIVWFAWGPPKPGLQRFKTRFLARTYDRAFYYDMDAGEIVDTVPRETSRAKHTQGLRGDLVEEHLMHAIDS